MVPAMAIGHELAKIKVLNLGREMCRKSTGVKITDRLDATTAFTGGLVNAVHGMAERRNHAHSGHDNTTTIYTGPEPLQIRRPRRNFQPTGSVSFFPEGSLFGRHELKAGFSTYFMSQGSHYPDDGLHGNYRLIFSTQNGIPHQPLQLITYSIPVTPTGRLNEAGVYLQDTWRISDRATVNAGLRFFTVSVLISLSAEKRWPW